MSYDAIFEAYEKRTLLEYYHWDRWYLCRISSLRMTHQILQKILHFTLQLEQNIVTNREVTALVDGIIMQGDVCAQLRLPVFQIIC